MPISRIALGIVASTGTWKYGFYDFLKGYLLLISGAAFTSIVLLFFGHDPINNPDTYYVIQKKMVHYWTTFTVTSVFASSAAAVAGALILATRKSVFTSGVMIGLALVPTAAIVASSIINGDFQTAGKPFYDLYPIL
ncbi:MAG: DUF389 domain-containing protein [Bacteroidales bacterium]|nr:DUF389 domain-containing protein [Bacteroidales bacterium]